MPAIVDGAVFPTVKVRSLLTVSPVLRSMLPTAALTVSMLGVPVSTTTSSVDDGTPAGLQFAPSFQSPEPPSQVFVSAAALPAHASHTETTRTSALNRRGRGLPHPSTTPRSSLCPPGWSTRH